MPKPVLRGMAWVAGALSFAAPLVAFNAVPKPLTTAGTEGRRLIIVHKTIKRIVIEAPVIAAGGGAPTVRYVYAPAAAPAAVTCGSHC